MRLSIDPGFVPKTTEPRYYSRWLEKWEQGWKSGHRWQLRVFGVSGRANASIELSPLDSVETVQRDLPFAISGSILREALNGTEGYLSDAGKVTDGHGRELLG